MSFGIPVRNGLGVGLLASTFLSTRRGTGGGGGPTAALDLNFITGSYQTGGGSYAFQDLIRFSRTTAGTFVGSNGLIQNSPISNNLLLWTEEADNAAWAKTAVAVQSNLLLRSQEYDNASWVKNTATITANAIAAPDGTLSAEKLVIDSAAPFTSSYIRQNISKTANTTTYTSSVYAKIGEFNRVRLFARDNAAGTNSASVTVSLVDGSIVSAAAAIGTFTNASATVTDAGNGWYRVALTFTTGTETTIWGQAVFAEDSVATTGDGTSGIYIWGSQLVNGPVAETYWATLASAVATQHLAPNGVLSANKIVENSANTYHFVREAVTAANVAHTFTTYLKAGERTRVIVSMSDITTGDAFIGVDLTNGTTFTATGLSVGSWTSISSSVTSVGSGWYRVSVTATKGAGTQIAGSVFPTNGTSATFLGDGSSGFYMWGSQLEVGSSATAYSRNADGRYAPRFDYDPVTLEAKGLLIEEQRTNLLTYSEQFDNAAWLPGAVTTVTVTANAATSPDGTADADKLIIANGVSAGTTTYLYTNISKSAVATTYTFSCYAKEAEYDLFRILINDNAASANFALGAWSLVDGSVNEVPSVGGTFTNPSGTATAVGNGWYRITMTFTSSTENILRVRIYPRDSSGVVTGDGVSGIYIFGAQLEAGASATAYIPTAASTVTRNIENALTLGPAFSSFYNQTQGTFVVELDMSATTGRWIVSASDGTTSNVVGMNTSSGGGPRASITYAGTGQSSVGASFVVTPNQLVKLGMAYSATSTVVAANGTLSVEDTSAMIPTVSQLQLFANGAAAAVGNGRIRRVRYYNTRLTDAQLQALTT